MVYKITFSPTGGTMKVADLLASAFSKSTTHIDLTNRSLDFNQCHFSSEDICIVAVPSFGGRVPDIAVKRLKQMSGDHTKTVLVVAYGNRAYEDTLLELKNTLTTVGFCCVAAVAAVAEHSIMRQFATARPDDQDKVELLHFGQEIQKALQLGICKEIAVPGHFPYREYNGLAMKPKTGKSCTACGLCSEKCPVGAIPKNNPRETDTEKCITCMRCVAICPQNSRKLNELMVAIGAQKLKKFCSERKSNELFL